MKKITLLVISFLIYSNLCANDRIIVLDVGEGQAVLLKQDNVGTLIDVGHPGMSARVLQQLMFYQVDDLAYIILTHLHSDHAGGYFRLREAFPDATILHSGHPLPDNVTPDLVRWVNLALKKDKKQKKILGGTEIRWQNFILRFLWPYQFKSNNLNRHSLVIQIEIGQAKTLLMGDADKVVERALLESGAIGPVHVLIAGHHGSSETGDIEFLKALAPEFSVVSVNANNIRGYPDAATLSTLKRFSGKLLRTDQHGDICFDLNKTPGMPLQLCK